MSLLERLTTPRRGETHSLNSFRLSQTVREKELIGILNAAPLRPEGMMAKWLVDISELLRQWVDEWVDSGRAADGTDRPEQRRLKQRSALDHAIFEYSQTAGNISLLADHEGKIVMQLLPPPGNDGYNSLDQWPRPEVIAQSYLVFLLASPLSRTIAKCRASGCGCYFALKQTKRPYLGGTLCDAHRRKRDLNAAKSATKEDRKTARLMLYSLAAKRFVRRIEVGKPWEKDKRLKAELVRYLNEQIERSDALRAVYLAGGRKGISTNWVALKDNRNGIEKKLKEGLKNAKG